MKLARQSKKTGILLAALACVCSSILTQRRSLLAQSTTLSLTMPREKTSVPDPNQQITVVIGGSTGIGLSYLPLTIMEEQKLLDKHAAALGINATMHFQRFPTAAPMYDALLAGKIAFAAGGITQLLTSWEKTRLNPALAIKGVGALNAMPLYLVTSNPKVKKLADFTPHDKIALVAVRTSIEAVVLSMATEQAFGAGQAAKLAPLTTAVGHPEAMQALLSGHSDLDAHLASAPFFEQELAKPGIHKVFDSYQVLGGPHTHNVVWTTTKFDTTNPQVVAAFVGALQEALTYIKTNPGAAAASYLRNEPGEQLSIAQVEKIIRNPENEWTMTPKKFMAFATFMNQTDLLPTKPTDWHELFFPIVKGLPGS